MLKHGVGVMMKYSVSGKCTRGFSLNCNLYNYKLSLSRTITNKLSVFAKGNLLVKVIMTRLKGEDWTGKELDQTRQQGCKKREHQRLFKGFNCDVTRS